MVVAGRTSSTSSTASLALAGAHGREQRSSSQELIRRRESGLEVYDAACALVYCPTHRKYGVCKVNSWKGLFLPTAVVSPVDGFARGLEARMKQLLQHPDARTGFVPHMLDASSCLEYTRIQVPVVEVFVTRVTYKVTMTGVAGGLCCKDVFSMEWMTAEEVEGGGSLWGPEVAWLVSGHQVPAFQELSCRGEVAAAAQAAKEAGYSAADVHRLHQDFVQHVFPSTHMSRSSCLAYLRATGVVDVEDEELPQRLLPLFFPASQPHSQSQSQSQGISFHAFLQGIARTDPESPGSGAKGLRSFRHVASNKDSLENVAIEADTFANVSRLSRGSAAQHKELCFKCESENVTLASYAVSLTASSCVEDPLAIAFSEEDQKRIASRALSREQVDHTSIGNTMVRWIQEQSLLQRDPKVLADYVTRISAFCARVMAHEARVVEKASPCFVIGCLLGSLRDLLALERRFWRRGIQFETASYVFLGNAIEVGEDSLSVLLYLLAIKCLAPARVCLLRGQTEQRTRLRSLKQQLKRHLPERQRQVRQALSAVLDAMPVAALVDTHAFLTSASLPEQHIPSLHHLNQAIPCPLANPDSHPLVRHLTSAPPPDPPDPKWEQETRQQLSRLGISTLVRSFQWSARGIRRLIQGNLISIFSASDFKGSGNPSSLLLISNGSIRSILLQDPRHPIRASDSRSSLAIPSPSSSSSSDSDSTPAAKKKSSDSLPTASSPAKKQSKEALPPASTAAGNSHPPSQTHSSPPTPAPH